MRMKLKKKNKKQKTIPNFYELSELSYKFQNRREMQQEVYLQNIQKERLAVIYR